MMDALGVVAVIIFHLLYWTGWWKSTVYLTKKYNEDTASRTHAWAHTGSEWERRHNENRHRAMMLSVLWPVTLGVMFVIERLDKAVGKPGAVLDEELKQENDRLNKELTRLKLEMQSPVDVDAAVNEARKKFTPRGTARLTSLDGETRDIPD